jgi:hypothetical protein
MGLTSGHGLQPCPDAQAVDVFRRLCWSSHLGISPEPHQQWFATRPGTFDRQRIGHHEFLLLTLEMSEAPSTAHSSNGSGVEQHRGRWVGWPVRAAHASDISASAVGHARRIPQSLRAADALNGWGHRNSAPHGGGGPRIGRVGLGRLAPLADYLGITTLADLRGMACGTMVAATKWRRRVGPVMVCRIESLAWPRQQRRMKMNKRLR